MKQLRKPIKLLILSIIALCMLYPLFVFGRLQGWEKASSVKETIDKPNRLTIIYRNHCPRCKKTLPKLFLKHGMENKKVILINADNLSKEELDELDVQKTPVFRINKHSYNTMDHDLINELWNKSK